MFNITKFSLLFSLFTLVICHGNFTSFAVADTQEQNSIGTSFAVADTPEQIANKKVMDWMKANPIKLNPSCFYSGFTKTDDGHIVQAQKVLTTKWIGQRGGAPRNCQLLGYVVDASGANPDDIQDWSTVSKAFAETVAGPVYVLLGRVINANSIWLEYERPALENNTAVAKPLQFWEIDNRGNVVKMT